MNETIELICARIVAIIFISIQPLMIFMIIITSNRTNNETRYNKTSKKKDQK